MTELTSVQDQVIDAIADRVAQRMRRPPTGVVKQINNVDLAAQLDSYLKEVTRKEHTEREVRSSIEHYLTWTTEHGLPVDSKQAAAGWKAVLLARNLSRRTVNAHLGRVSSFLRWAEAHGWASGDPVRAVKIKPGKKTSARDDRDAYSPDEVRAFLRTLSIDVDPREWLLVTLIYQGMRLGEAAQLYLADIKCQDGVHYFEVDERLPGQSVKNDQSRRVIPVHQALLDLGLLDHVARLRKAGADRLHPYWTSDRPSKSAGVWIRKFRLKGQAHKLRHSFATGLRDADVSETLIAELMGHERGSTMSLMRYAKNSPLPKLKAAIDKLVY